MTTTPEPSTAPHTGTSLWPVGDDGRRIVRIGEDPDAIRFPVRASEDRAVRMSA